MAIVRNLADLGQPIDGTLSAVNADKEDVAASKTEQVLGANGAIGDYLEGILVIPATTSPGAVAVLDGSSSTTVFAGGASSVGSLIPFYIPINNVSENGAWKITTGANVSVRASGRFS